MILDQIDMIKSKASEVVGESSARQSVQNRSDELMNTLLMKNRDVLQALKQNEVEKKFEQCEMRMKSFEEAIEQILNFTKKTSKDIQDLQSNLSFQNITASHANGLSSNKKTPSDMLSNTLLYPQQTHKKHLDDTVNYKSKDSLNFNFGYTTNKNTTLKPRNKSVNHQSASGANELRVGKEEPNNSILLNGSLNDFNASPILHEKLAKAPKVDIPAKATAYRTCDYNVSSSKNENSIALYQHSMSNNDQHKSMFHMAEGNGFIV